MTEYHDGRPVTRYEAWFRRKIFEVPAHDAASLEEDRVVPWLVVGVSRDSAYAKRRDDPDSKTRTCIIDVDTVAPLPTSLYDQALASANGNGLRARVDARPGDIDLDRLADYLRTHWGLDATTNDAIDTAIGLLERHEPHILTPGPTRPPEPPPSDEPTVSDSADDFLAGAEIVGAAYRNRRTRALLEEAFGDQPT